MTKKTLSFKTDDLLKDLRDSIHREFFMKGQEKGDLLIQVAA